MKNTFSTESFGVVVTENKMSKNEQHAINIMKETVRKSDEKYEIGLLWKTKHPRLPESKSMALQKQDKTSF